MHITTAPVLFAEVPIDSFQKVFSFPFSLFSPWVESEREELFAPVMQSVSQDHDSSSGIACLAEKPS